MTKPDYVYVTYIATTPEAVWNAFMDTGVMEKYWNGGECSRVNVSDWKPGSRWEHVRTDGSGIVDIVGRVVENDAPRRLVYTWARPEEEHDETRHARVAIDIEPVDGGLVKLTVAHTGLDEKMFAGISKGWPRVLSNLKTLLETGRAFPRRGATS